METVCGSAAASGDTTEAALGRALSGARAALNGREPDLCLLFASPRHPLQDVVAEAAGSVPGTVLACSSAGEIATSGRVDGGIAAFMCAWGDRARHVTEPLVSMDPEAEASSERLTAGFAAHAAAAKADGLAFGLSLVFGDGLSPALEALVAKMRQRMPAAHGVVGGGAADDGLLARTFVGSGRMVASSSAVAAHVASDVPWGVGVGRGATPVSEPMTVTRATGNVVHALDGRPALDVYRDFARSLGVCLEDDARLRRFLIEYELGIHFFEEVARIRAGVATLPDGSVVFAGEVPEGASVSFVHGAPESYVAEAQMASQSARDALGDRPAAGVLAVSCVTRGIVLGDRYGEELDAIRDVFGEGVPIGGFLSYGEVARVPGKADGYHNNSLVVIAIPR